MRNKHFLLKLLLITVSAVLLSGCGKHYTAEVSISEKYEETTDSEDDEDEEYIEENENDDASVEEIAEIEEVSEENISTASDITSWSYEEKENEIKSRLCSACSYLDSNAEFRYTLYEDKRLLIVKAGSEYAYELFACVFDANWSQFVFVDLGNERTNVYVLPGEGKVVTISSGGAGEETYCVYTFESEQDYYFIEMNIEVLADLSGGPDNAVYNMIAIGGEYVAGEYWPDTKERLIDYSVNFLTEDYGYLWANEQDSRYDSEAFYSSYAGN